MTISNINTKTPLVREPTQAEYIARQLTKQRPNPAYAKNFTTKRITLRRFSWEA